MQPKVVCESESDWLIHLNLSKNAKADLGISIRQSSISLVIYTWQDILVCSFRFKLPKSQRTSCSFSWIGGKSLNFVMKLTRQEWQASCLSQMPKTDKSWILRSFSVSSRLALTGACTGYFICGEPSANTVKLTSWTGCRLKKLKN